MAISVPPGLAQLAGDRDQITLHEFATLINRADQTLRKEHCLRGHVYGVRLKKIGNRLHAPVAEVARLLTQGQQPAPQEPAE